MKASNELIFYTIYHTITITVFVMKEKKKILKLTNFLSLPKSLSEETRIYKSTSLPWKSRCNLIDKKKREVKETKRKRTQLLGRMAERLTRGSYYYWTLSINRSRCTSVQRKLIFPVINNAGGNRVSAAQTSRINNTSRTFRIVQITEALFQLPAAITDRLFHPC